MIKDVVSIKKYFDDNIIKIGVKVEILEVLSTIYDTTKYKITKEYALCGKGVIVDMYSNDDSENIDEIRIETELDEDDDNKYIYITIDDILQEIYILKLI